MEVLPFDQIPQSLFKGNKTTIEESTYQNMNSEYPRLEDNRHNENKDVEQFVQNIIEGAKSSLIEESNLNKNGPEGLPLESNLGPIVTTCGQISEAIKEDISAVTGEEPKPAPKRNENSPLECNICYEESIEPVATHCGHIFCWSCVYKWIEIKRGSAECPNCKNTITKEKLIPLYPKNYDDEKKNADVTNGVPKRPLAARDDNNSTFRGSGIFTGINIHSRHFGMTIGCLPTLLPIVIMVLVNIYAILTGNDDYDYEISQSDADEHFGQRPGRSYHDSSEEFYHETDGFDWAIILIMIIFVSLPFILRRFSRRNY